MLIWKTKHSLLMQPNSFPSYALRKSLQTASTSPCRRYMLLTSSVLSATSKQCFELTSSVLSTTSKQCFELTSSVSSTTSKQCFEQPAASFLVCSLIFIEYKNRFSQFKEKKDKFLSILTSLAGISLVLVAIWLGWPK